jgi:putative FmdB family regulatory protein
MPIYEYDCSKCGHIEAFQGITEEPLTRCPTCQRKVTKLISQSSFQLKGTGWYVTDYAGKGRGGPSEPANDAPKESSGKTSDKGSEKSSDKSSDSSGSTASSSDSSKKTKKADSKTSGSGSKAA